MSNPKDTSGDQTRRRGGRQPAPPRTTTGEESPSPPPPMQQTENPSFQTPHHADAGGATGDAPPSGVALSAGGGGSEGGNVGSGQAKGGGDRRSKPPKKRFRKGDPGADRAGSSSKLKKKQTNDQPQPPPGFYKCSVCSRTFDKNKSLFGHMRSHSDRPWRGAYPPPVFSHEEIDEDMAAVIERLRGRVSDETAETREEVAAVAESTPDLNEPAAEVDAGQPSSPKRNDGLDIDLNRSPSPDT